MASLDKVRVITTNYCLMVYGNTTNYIKRMTPEPKDKDKSTTEVITKIMHQHPIMPYRINWDTLTKDNILFCIRPDNGQHYYFKMNNPDNLKNDYLIPKIGISYFHSNKYNTYIC
jgi:hypothetical protein